MKSKKSYLGFVLWIFGMASAQLATVLLPKMDSHLQIVIYMNIVVISIFVLSLIIYLTENVYWYNGVEFSEALEAGTEKRKAYALSHMKRFGGFTGIFIVYSCIAILIGIPMGIDIIITVVGLITTAISTIHIKL